MRLYMAGLAFAAAIFLARAALAEDTDMPPVDYPAIPAKVGDRAQLVPPGWTLEVEAKGDLDGDKRPDLALIIQSEKPDIAYSGEPTVGPRMLVIGFASGKGYDRIITNHRLIPRQESTNVTGYLAESGPLEIKRGRLVVTLNLFMTAGGWNTWTNSFSFVMQKGKLRLVRFESNNWHRRTGETTLTVADYRARTLRITRGSMQNERKKTESSKLTGPARLTLDQIGNGLQFDPAPKSSNHD
ncbi:hypothetical protein E2F50_10575 [Rhizobium deserti]|uniref:Uncharacterized protein n=1 Tax=Rhizobium deserti TaxID=2547961 RepID=A0A4R5UK90_9HYPH|nr:hypothetical protein [Rhizobium deserti]TDK37312.1 hypothetical protein E2F50_10575 [Rhizobium deserti]